MPSEFRIAVLSFPSSYMGCQRTLEFSFDCLCCANHALFLTISSMFLLRTHITYALLKQRKNSGNHGGGAARGGTPGTALSISPDAISIASTGNDSEVRWTPFFLSCLRDQLDEREVAQGHDWRCNPHFPCASDGLLIQVFAWEYGGVGLGWC